MVTRLDCVLKTFNHVSCQIRRTALTKVSALKRDLKVLVHGHVTSQIKMRICAVESEVLTLLLTVEKELANRSLPFKASTQMKPS